MANDKASSHFIETARQVLRSAGYCVEKLWHVNDVHCICEAQDLPGITDEEAQQVFQIASEQFDGDDGLSWPKLERALRTFLHRKIMLNRMCVNERTFS